MGPARVHAKSVSAAEIAAAGGFSRLAILTIAEVGLALILGGGTLQGLWSDALVQLMSLPLLAIAANELLTRGLPAKAGWPLGLVVIALLLPVIQLIPLPPSLWIQLPGRGPFLAAYREAGMAVPWSSLSLDPAATKRSLLSLLPAISVFLAVLSLDARARRFLSLIVLAFAVASALLGLAQLAGGPSSPLRFYYPTNAADSVGFFANRNHYAALLYAAIPLATAWCFALLLDERSRRSRRSRRSSRRFGLLLIALAGFFIVLGEGMTRSRAGVMLAFVAGLASIFVGWGVRGGTDNGPRRRKALLAVVAANVVGLLVAFQFGFVGIANRFGNDKLLDDLRWPIAEKTLQATTTNLPLGVGFGAFQSVYQMFETPSVVVEPYVNHAHDDWLELALDGGVPAVAAMLAFLSWYVVASLRVWRTALDGDRLINVALGRAGSIIVGALLIHSAVDYPLRTTTLMVIFAYGCALMIPPIGSFSKQRVTPHGESAAV